MHHSHVKHQKTKRPNADRSKRKLQRQRTETPQVQLPKAAVLQLGSSPHLVGIQSALAIHDLHREGEGEQQPWEKNVAVRWMLRIKMQRLSG